MAHRGDRSLPATDGATIDGQPCLPASRYFSSRAPYYRYEAMEGRSCDAVDDGRCACRSPRPPPPGGSEGIPGRGERNVDANT